MGKYIAWRPHNNVGDTVRDTRHVVRELGII